ncbi:MAG: hypothetical protein WCC69_10395 [Pirellulales bacterium]
MLGGAVLAAVVVAGLVSLALWPAAGRVERGLCGGLAAGLSAVVILFVWAAAQPRLARRGDRLVARLAPFTVHEVPLEVVECVFHGSQPLDAAAGTPALRVGTIVVRLAERATEWRERPSFPAWGSWVDGHIVCDGRWCEPLSVDRARAISGSLLEAKREVAAAGPSA